MPDTFANAFMYSGIGMALVSPEGKWLAVNDALCDITDYSREELLQLTFQDITHPDDLALDVRLVHKMLAREIETYNLEKRYISKNRRIVWAILTVSLVWNEDNTPKFFIAQIVDITKQHQLVHDIQVKNSELEATQISLIDKIRQLEDLSYIIAHNMRGPANNIRMLSGELSKAAIDGSNDIQCGAFTLSQIIDLNHRSSSSLVETLETLMAITQVKLNTEIPYNECDISQTIEQVTNQLSGMIFEKNAVIETYLEIKSISYPKAYLENILYNLISNALKYCCIEGDPLIVISTRKEGARTVLSVKDNGLGIDLQKNGDKIFKLHQVFHTGFDSKGVGLYLIKTQIESLHGSITVLSEEHKGSEFIVTL